LSHAAAPLVAGKEVRRDRVDALLYVASALTGLWGVAHLFATRGVVDGFGELSADNRRIITMEWIVEGVALVSLAALVVAVTAVDAAAAASSAAYAVAIATLVVLACVSAFTGFRVAFLPFRLCPFIFTLSAVLIALGAWL
jgi:hypothetical protein